MNKEQLYAYFSIWYISNLQYHPHHPYDRLPACRSSSVPARLILSTSSRQTSSMWLRRWHRTLLALLKASVGRLRALECRLVARGTHSRGAAWVNKDREWKIYPGIASTARSPLPPLIPCTIEFENST